MLLPGQKNYQSFSPTMFMKVNIDLANSLAVISSNQLLQ